MRIPTGLALAGTLLTLSGCAQGPGYYAPPRPYGEYGAAEADAVCSGARARALEQRLSRAVYERRINPYTADRIHARIDGLENRQARECAERDWGAIRGLSHDYDGVSDWIAREAHW